MEFNVFLSHNSKDKQAVRELKLWLSANGLAVWLDEDELQPGLPWQQLLESGIKTSRSIAVLVGKDGLGPWEDEEMQAALVLAVRDKRPVIPVLLPHASAKPELPMFLVNRTWVDLRAGLTEDGLAKLVWGITGIRPDPKSRWVVPPAETGPAADSTIPPQLPNHRRSPHDYRDRTVKGVAVALEEAKPLTMRDLILHVDVLFNRGTFRFEPLRECVTQEWERRLLAAMETFELLRGYSSFVSDRAPDARAFEKLMDAVNGYCLAMATYLFEEPVKVSELRDYLGTSEFLTRLPKSKHWPSAGEIDDDTNKRVDGLRTRSVRQMDKLRKEFLGAPASTELNNRNV
jgi:hypothetical protein